MKILVYENKDVLALINISGLSKEEIERRYKNIIFINESLDKPLNCYEVVDNQIKLKDECEEE